MKYEFASKTILLAEDDEASAVYLSELLKIYNANVEFVVSGLEAVEFCINNVVDIVLMDMKLPEMSGYEATRLIKKHNAFVPIIAVTASAMLEDRRRCKIAGCDGYLSKPIMPGELLPMIKNFINRQRINSFTENL
jgi:CheY-like chemotaxis protein